MKQANRNKGRQAEELARDYLVAKGYEIVESNYSTRYGEIDLIMKDKSVLVFVEVKAKFGKKFGLPEEMFGRGKYNQVKRTAVGYLHGKEVECRIDMVAVELDEAGNMVELRHYENVVL